MLHTNCIAYQRQLTGIDIIIKNMTLGASQVLRNAVGVWVSAFLGKKLLKVYDPTLLALRGGGCGSNFLEKSIT